MQFDHSFEVIYPSSTGVDSISIGGNASLVLPVGTAAQRPATPVAGALRFLSTTNSLEVYTGSAWSSPVISASGDAGVAASVVNGALTLSSSTNVLALGSLTGQGFIARASAGTLSVRTLTGTTNQITVTNGDGSAGAPTLTLDSNIIFPGTNGINLPVGTTAQRPGAPVGKTARFNSTTGLYEFYNGTAWINFMPYTTASANTVFAGPATGAAAQPAFRAIALSQNDLSDAVISSPSNGQVLTYNSTTSKWVNSGAVGANAAGLIGVGQTGVAAWTLLSGSSYYADFVHNLGTTNIVVTVYDTSNNAMVLPDSLVCTSTTTIRVTVIGNTKTLKVVAVANGQSIVAGGSTPSAVVMADEGVTTVAAATKLNFIGSNVTVTDAGSGTANVSITGSSSSSISRYVFFPYSLDNPTNANWAINALAPAITDSANTSLTVRAFNNIIEQGVGLMLSIPTGATSITIKTRGRAAAAPTAASVVQPRWYVRLIPDNTAVGAWNAAVELANIAIPTNTNFQYASQTATLASLGMAAGNLYQIEYTRRVSGVTGTNLSSTFLLAELTIEIS